MYKCIENKFKYDHLISGKQTVHNFTNGKNLYGPPKRVSIQEINLLIKIKLNQ